MDLHEFDFDVRHRPGNSIKNANALSRLNHNQTPEVAGSISLTPATNLLQAQRNDRKDIRKVVELKEQGFPKPPNFVWKGNSSLRTYWECWDQLFVSNGLLVRSLDNNKHFPRHALVILRTLVAKVLEGLHKGPVRGHMGITCTIKRARERFFWPQMRTSIIDFIKKCVDCSQSKYQPHQSNAPLQPVRLSEPFVFGLWIIRAHGPFHQFV